MQHLTEEELVAFHYRDHDALEEAKQHLGGCTPCATRYEAIRRVLAVVTAAPIPDRGEEYGAEVWARLRWKLGSGSRSRRWQPLVAAAALLTLAFFAGLLWRDRREAPAAVAVAAPEISAAGVEAVARLLEVVVSDHLDTSGRMLMEVANASSDTQLSAQPRRAGDLVAANRIYRQTAVQRGDERIAQLLADLEPILLELANAGDSLEGKKLADLQKRIESGGLLFKVRVMSTPATGSVTPLPPQSQTDSL